MATIRVKGDKSKYSVLNDQCIGCECLSLGQYQHRGATLSGSRNTGAYSACCMTRAYHGCPDESTRKFSDELKRKRKDQGMRNS